MGSSKTINNSQTSQTSTPTPPAYVDEYNRQATASAQALLPQQQQLQSTGMQAAQNVYSAFANNTPLTGYLAQLQGVTPEQQDQMVKSSMRYLSPQFQQGGYLNSGAAASIESRTAADLMNQNAQFNVGALQNLLNLVNTGQAQVQQPINAASAVTSSRLAGLNSVNTQGNGTNTALGQNPFVNSFQTGLGSSFGGGLGNAFWKG